MNDAHAAHDAGHGGHSADHSDGHGLHLTLDGYLIGFGLSVILTAIPFGLVMSGVLESKNATAFAITILAVVQIVVHMVFFLHMTPSAEGGWSMMALIFTIVMVVITLTGSLWVMYHLVTNMMPTDPSQLP